VQWIENSKIAKANTYSSAKWAQVVSVRRARVGEWSILIIKVSVRADSSNYLANLKLIAV